MFLHCYSLYQQNLQEIYNLFLGLRHRHQRFLINHQIDHEYHHKLLWDTQVQLHYLKYLLVMPAFRGVSRRYFEERVWIFLSNQSS